MYAWTRVSLREYLVKYPTINVAIIAVHPSPQRLYGVEAASKTNANRTKKLTKRSDLLF